VPKVVDHEQRRVEIVQAAYRVIANDGWDATTMAAIAAEAGYTNGALKPYFASKDELMAAAFDYIYVQTGARMAAATAGKRGLAALRAYIHEILPLKPETLDEARIVIPFWHRALTTPALVARHEEAMSVWRDQIRTYLTQARDDADLTGAASDESVVGLLLTALLGAQITGALLPGSTSPEALATQIEALLTLLATDRCAQMVGGHYGGST
jgi:AcrR family transcriptional regulator